MPGVALGKHSSAVFCQDAASNHLILTQDYEEADVPIWSEVLFAAELLMLHVAPVYYGVETPRGDGLCTR